MFMHVRMLNTNWKYCQVEIQNVFIRAETMILWKRSEMSRNKKFNRISLYVARNSNIKLKFSVTGRRINHFCEISRILIMYNIGRYYNKMLLVFQLLKIFDSLDSRSPAPSSFELWWCFTLHANYKGRR